MVRDLIPAIPIPTVIGAVGIVSIIDKFAAPRNLVRRSIAFVLAISLGSAAIVVALSLAIAGPNQSTWTTALPPNSDLMRNVEALGSTPDTLWMAFEGDSLPSRLNARSRPGASIATFDTRLYWYKTRPISSTSMDSNHYPSYTCTTRLQSNRSSLGAVFAG